MRVISSHAWSTSNTSFHYKFMHNHAVLEFSWSWFYIFLVFPDVTFGLLLQISMEVKELRKELDDKISEIKRLQSELTRRDLEDELEEPTDTLRGMITTLKEENANLKVHTEWSIFCMLFGGSFLAIDKVSINISHTSFILLSPLFEVNDPAYLRWYYFLIFIFFNWCRERRMNLRLP